MELTHAMAAALLMYDSISNHPNRPKIYENVIAGVPPQPMNFSSYLNGEPVRNTDIVNWVTVGAYDVPTSESAPVTAVTGRQLSFWLRPYNYFDRVRLGPQAFFSLSLSP